MVNNKKQTSKQIASLASDILKDQEAMETLKQHDTEPLSSLRPRENQTRYPNLQQHRTVVSTCFRTFGLDKMVIE